MSNEEKEEQGGAKVFSLFAYAADLHRSIAAMKTMPENPCAHDAIGRKAACSIRLDAGFFMLDHSDNSDLYFDGFARW